MILSSAEMFQSLYNKQWYPDQTAMGAQWLSGRVLDSRPKGRGFEPHRRHCVVSLSKNINPSLVLVQPRKTRPFITERLLMGRKESNQTKRSDCSIGEVRSGSTLFVSILNFVKKCTRQQKQTEFSDEFLPAF